MLLDKSQIPKPKPQIPRGPARLIRPDKFVGISWDLDFGIWIFGFFNSIKGNVA